jgi:NAD(P)-dependent dehydrogenase (short-subunit alcohol dehydrogenase family)
VVLFTAARIPLARFSDVDAALWRELFETNAVGAFLVAGAALPHLGDTGVFAYVSTIGVDSPYPGRGAYIASKAALDGGFRALRVENPDARITRILLDPTSGTGAGSGDDPALAYELMTDWVRLGKVPDRMLSAQQVARGVCDALAAALAYPGALAEVALASRWRPVAVDVDRQEVISKLQQVRQV